MELACESARSIGEACAAAIWIADSGSDFRLACTAVAEGFSATPAQSPPASAAMGAGSLERRGFRLIGADCERFISVIPARAACLVCIPLATPTQNYGWLCLSGKIDGSTFDQEGQRLAATIAGQVALAYEAAMRSRSMEQDRDRLQAAVTTQTAELTRSNESLTCSLTELNRRNREMTQLGELGELLHACESIDDARHIFSGFLPSLFPNSSGVLYQSDVANLLDPVAHFGDSDIVQEAIGTSACWGLRRLRTHAVWDARKKPACQHVPLRENDADCSYICAPLIAQGGVIGLFHLRCADAFAGQSDAAPALEWLATSVANQFGLAISSLNLRKELLSQAISDPLTGLFNRRHMEESLAREIHRSRRNKTGIGVVIFDLDYFKRYNDVHGHQAGDALLRAFANLLNVQSRGSDIACRWGGEEFVLIMPDAPDAAVLRRAEQIRDMTKDLSSTHAAAVISPVSLSAGVALFPQHGESPHALLRAADRALYQAKIGGRDRVVVAADAP